MSSGKVLFQKKGRLKVDTHRRQFSREQHSKELQLYASKARDINRRFRGRHIAIVGGRIVASGKSPIEVWKRARKTYPKSKPVLAYVPKDEAEAAR